MLERKLYTSLMITLLSCTTLSAINIDSLNFVLTETGKRENFEVAHMIATEIANVYTSKKQFNKAIKYFLIARAHIEELDDLELLSQNFISTAGSYQSLNQKEKALDELLQLTEGRFKSIKNESKAEIYRSISSLYLALGDYKVAFEHQLQVLQIKENMKDSVGMAESIYSIGTIFFYQQSYSTALEKYIEAFNILENTNQQYHKFNCLAAIGSSYEHLENYEQSLEYSKRALEMASQIDYKAGISYAAHNIGSTYGILGEHEKALNYVNQALKIQREANDLWGQTTSLRTIAFLKIKSGHPEEAIAHLDRALELSQDVNNNRTLEIYRNYASAYYDMGNYEKSTEYLEKFIELKDTVINELALREMGQKSSEYEIEKRENEINSLKNEKDLLKKDKEIQALYQYFLIIAAMFLLLFLRLMYNRYKVQKNTNRLLEEKSEQIRRQNLQMEQANEKQKQFNKILAEKNLLLEKMNQKVNQQNEKLEDSNEDLKQFAYVASHDLKEPLRMIGSYTSLLKRRYSSTFDENATEFMGYITDAVGRMEVLLNDLLAYSRLNTQEQKHEVIGTVDVVDMVLANLRLKIEEQAVNVIYERDKMPEIMGSRSQLGQLFQNLISNAIKFTKAENPIVRIDCKWENDSYVFSVSDNGIGISKENLNKIFDMFRRLHSRQEYEGSGIGLSTCKKIVEKHFGKLWVESQPGEGSTFYFSLPVVKKSSQPNDENKANVLVDL